MARAIHIADPSLEVRDAHFWRHAVGAGIIGGIVFMMAQMMMVTLIGQSPWAPPRMIAAMILEPEAMLLPAGFDIGVMAAAMAVHFPLSVVYGIVIGWMVQRTAMRSYTVALAEGAFIGLVIYLLDFYIIASFVFEWFSTARNWVSFTTHAIFGLTTAWAFLALAEPEPRARGGRTV